MYRKIKEGGVVRVGGGGRRKGIYLLYDADVTFEVYTKGIYILKTFI